MRRFRHLLLALALVATGAGCELIVRIDPSLLPGAGGGGGSGGAGSATGTGGASSATGTGRHTGTGGKPGTGATSSATGTGGGCSTAADCPPSTKVCAAAECSATSHTCGIVDIAAGDPAAASAQTQGDCKQVVCDGAGNPMSVNDDTDVPDDGEVCTDDSCNAGVPVHTPNTDTCSENNGKVCGTPGGPKAGKCVACNVDADCTGNGVCQLNLCVTSACDDQVQDGSETDVDCGGTCAPCPDHDKCKVDADCQSDACSLSGTCTPASCTDGILNEGETDVDCGGPVCGAEGKLCGTGKTCAKAADCQSDNCDTTVAHVCKAPTCIDGILNEGETDIDCGGPSCGGCVNGKKCVGDGDCISQGCSITSLTCVPQCTDGRKDGVETDVDCGGANTCPRCPNTEGCALDSDCGSNACDAVSHTCVADQCTDHRTDGVETDIDCGGGTCATCGFGKNCKVDGDCATAGCSVSSLTCVLQCADGSQDGLETDIDCGGGNCVACGAGSMCKVDSDCASVACQTTQLRCVTPCTDGHLDGSETDIDCGGGTCPTCTVGQKCLVDGDCANSACDNVTGQCVSNPCADQHVDGAETDVDCGGGTCTGCAVGLKCLVDGDCGSDACDNVTGQCVTGQCVDQHLDGSETDVDCGGGTCPGCAVGLKCLLDGDCGSGGCDNVSGLCVSGPCVDQHVDGVETDVDCGGGTCPGCAVGLKCVVDGDCAGGACDTVTGLCVASQCADQHVDGLETDTDCGGGTCPQCKQGQKCAVDGDCVTAACDPVMMMCVFDQCMDEQQDGLETDVDCGGAGGCAQCPNGEKCLVGTDCASHACDGTKHCVDQCTDMTAGRPRDRSRLRRRRPARPAWSGRCACSTATAEATRAPPDPPAGA